MLSLPRSLAQGAFLKVEALFNRAFGERLNPFYYLGAIAYFQLWIVVVSGLYLYAFFETSVDGAYASVESLTHAQPWAGGILRSLHRYASDGMLLAMGLHLARHFVFGHHRGFRWFSWVSGVGLLWLVYVSGINGYMLVWDELAQFVVVASTEWLDALPIFNGMLARNFLYVASVSDRLFSLLSFLHIGLPLGVLALLWIHTQRVPKAHTQPPWPIAAGLAASLTVLSIAKPAVSHAVANLATVPLTLSLDWFYLPLLPLIYEWGAGPTWALVAGATALLLALPWIGPRRKAAEFAVSVHPDERIVTARRGETILEAGLREGLPMPFDCRNGGCGECKGRVLAGEVELGPYQESALTQAERAAGDVLFCVAEPLGDVEIEYRPVPGARPAEVHRYGARVAAMERLAPDVMKVMLQVDEGGKLRWHAGQYIHVLLEDGQKRSFSFATRPGTSDMVELHIRRIEGGLFTPRVFETMKVGDRIRFEGPLGAFHLREEGDKPILFVAGSTGFAPVKSMLEQAFATGIKRPMALYWGVRSRADLYAAELPERWAREHPNFTFVPVLSEPRPEDDWHGRTGLVHEAILADYPDLSSHQIYACGSVKMVEAVAPAFVSQGLSPDDCFSDAFHLAPQLRAREADVVRLGGQAMNWRSILLQVPAYAAFAAFVGYFSASPPYRHLAPDRAVVKLSFSHAGERKVECHTRSPEELAKLAPNMRALQDCPRERSDVKVEVEMDGEVIYRIAQRPSGLRHDLPTTVYRRLEVPAGRHTFRARLADTASGEYRHHGEASIDIAPGRVLVIDFIASRGGFLFRS